MHKIRSLAIATLVAAAVGLPALAQDKPPRRDSGGTEMDLSVWHEIKPHEFLLNIVDLPNVDLHRAQRRVRDKRAEQYRTKFDSGKGFMFVEHFLSARYTENSSEAFRAGESTRKTAEGFWKRAKESFEIEDKRKVYAFSERGGWVYATRGRTNGRRCILARMGFLSDPAKAAQSTYEVYDSGISYRDCSGKRTLDDVVTWLNGAKIVEPNYNRVR